MVIIMSKTANVTARIEPEVKEQAENILASLGIPASNAINMFYKQIILQKGMPFEIKLPRNPLDVSNMSEKEIDSHIEKGLQDIRDGKTLPADKFFSEFERQYGL